MANQEKDLVQELFDIGTSKKLDLGTFESFPQKLTDSGRRVEIFQLLSDTHDLGSFENFESKLKPLLPKTGISKFVSETVGKVFDPPSEEKMAAGRALKEQRDKKEVQDRMLPLQLRAPALQKILDEPESLNALTFEEIMNMAPMLGITRGDMFEALGPTLDKDNLLGFIKNILIGPILPGQVPREGAFAEALDRPLVDLTSNLPDEPPVDFMIPGFRGLTEKGQKIGWNITKGTLQFLEGFLTPANITLAGSIGLTSKTKDIGSAIFPAMFSADMISQNPELIRAIVDAFEEGDTDEAIQLITVTTLTNLLAGVLGKETFSRIREGKNVISSDAKPIWDDLRAALEQEGIESKVNESIIRVDNWIKNNASAFAKIAKVIDEKVISKEGFDITERAKAIDEAMASLDLKNQLIMKGAILKESQRPSGDVLEERGAKPGRKTELLAEEIGIRRVRGKDVTETKEINDPQTKFERDVEVVKDISENLPVEFEGVEEGGVATGMIVSKNKVKFINERKQTKEKTAELAEEGERLKSIDEVQVRFEEFLKEKQIGREADLKQVRKKIKVGEKVHPTGTETVKSIELAAIFLSKNFPRLYDSVDKIDIVNRRTFAGILKETGIEFKLALDNKTVGAFIFTPGKGIKILIKSNEVASKGLQEVLVKESPQIKLEPKRIRDIPSKETQTLDPITALRTLTHELRHALDFRTFGEDIGLAMDEVGKIMGKADLQAKAKRIKERGLKPQRYVVMLSERRARAQERTVIKSLREAMRESIRGFLELLGGDPSILAAGLPIFTEAGYIRAKPHIEQAWRNYKKAGADFAEFSKEFIEEFGENAEPYVKRLRAEFSAEGIDIGEGVKEIEIEHPEFTEPDPSSLPPDTSIDVRLDAYTEVRDRIRFHRKKWNEKLADIFSIEARGRRIGAPETALAFKNFFSEEFRHQDQALSAAAKMVGELRRTSKDFRFKPDKPALQEISLFMEDRKGMTPAQSKRYSGLLEAWNEYKKFAGNIYAKHGEGVNISRHVNSAFRGEIHKRSGENVGAMEAVAEIVSDIKPTSLEASLFLENFIRNDPDNAAILYTELRKAGVKTASLKSILETGIVAPSEINAVDLIAGLGRRLGQDSGILNIRTAAVKEGLAKKFPAGKKLPMEDSFTRHETARYFENYAVHPILNEWLDRMTKPSHRGFDIISHGISAVKMASFFNPLFLPMYDIFQSAMLGTIKPHIALTAIGGVLGGIPGAAVGFATGEAITRTLSKGFYHSIKKTPLYYKAISGGMASQPFPNPFTSFLEAKEHVKTSLAPQKGQLWASAISNGVELSKAVVGVEMYKRYTNGERLWKIIAGNPASQLTKQLYNSSWGIAWQLDRGVRMGNYMWLRQGSKFRGAMGHTEAAQLTALANADYASVPAGTRKIMNLGFYTPTFKIAMGNFYAGMIGAAIKGVGRGTDLALGGVFKTEKMSKRDKVLSWGMFNTMAIGLGIHTFMISQGFKTVIPFVKYKRPTVTDEGPQDIVVNFSSPANIFFKYAFRVYNSLFTSSPSPKLKRLVNSFKWEFTPLLRVANNMVGNRDDSGDPITLTTDTDTEVLWKMTKYALYNTVQMAKLFSPEQNTVEARTALANEAGQLFELATAPFIFSYLKDPDAQIAASQINKMRSTFMDDMATGRIPLEDLDSHLEVLMDKIIDILETKGLLK